MVPNSCMIPCMFSRAGPGVNFATPSGRTCWNLGLQNVDTIAVYRYTIESRAETHERFYIIEVHRHRFEMSARKVPFEKCTRWRKVCGRSAKDQIGAIVSTHFFYDFERKVRERRAKDARKTYPLEPCPAQNGLHLAMPDIGPREKKQHITMTFWLLQFIRANNNRFIV